MQKSRYEECLSWASERGLVLDSRIERKEVNGVYGMYATAPIPEGTVIASFPLDACIPILDKKLIYPGNKQEYKQRIHATAKELSKGAQSEYLGCVMLFNTLEEHQKYSFCFFSYEESLLLSKMNPLLQRSIAALQYSTNNIVASIKEVDPDLDIRFIMQAQLNGVDRCWGAYGFVPILDLFNHSNTKGSIIKEFDDGKRIGHQTKTNYEAGDQIMISYGEKDMYNHATNYGYFDSNDEHFIDYAARAVQVLDSPAKLAVAEYISNNYKCYIHEEKGVKKMKILETNLFFSESSPSTDLLSYFAKTSFCTQQEFATKQCHPDSISSTLISVIDSFIDANHIDDFELSEIPEKLQHFYHLLKKEKKMLLKNREWVINDLKIQIK